MKEFEDLAEQVKNQLGLEYDTKSIKFIEGFIERQRNSFDNEQRKGLVNSIGSFVGQCIIRNYGGHWQVDRETEAICVAFDDKNKIFPIAKTTKQFENGLADSVYSFYTSIPAIFKIEFSAISKTDGNSQSPHPPSGSKKWWKFW